MSEEDNYIEDYFDGDSSDGEEEAKKTTRKRQEDFDREREQLRAQQEEWEKVVEEREQNEKNEKQNESLRDFYRKINSFALSFLMIMFIKAIRESGNIEGGRGRSRSRSRSRSSIRSRSSEANESFISNIKDMMKFVVEDDNITHQKTFANKLIKILINNDVDVIKMVKVKAMKLNDQQKLEILKKPLELKKLKKIILELVKFKKNNIPATKDKQTLTGGKKSRKYKYKKTRSIKPKKNKK